MQWRRQQDQERSQAKQNGSPHPAWDAERRDLRFAGQLVKKFHTPAPCQEPILGEFESLGWPQQIDDPLPPVKGQSGTRRLHNAVNCLNRSHRVRIIAFHAANAGTAIGWELIAAPPAVPAGDAKTAPEPANRRRKEAL